MASCGAVRQRLASCGNDWQPAGNAFGRTGLETRPTGQGLEMVEKGGNAGKRWQRWKKVATLEKAGNAGKCWQRWKMLATLENAGKAGKCWQRWKEIG